MADGHCALSEVGKGCCKELYKVAVGDRLEVMRRGTGQKEELSALDG